MGDIREVSLKAESITVGRGGDEGCSNIACDGSRSQENDSDSDREGNKGVSEPDQQAKASSKQTSSTCEDKNPTRETAITENTSSSPSFSLTTSTTPTIQTLTSYSTNIQNLLTDLEECFDLFLHLSDDIRRISLENQRVATENHHLECENLRLARELATLNSGQKFNERQEKCLRRQRGVIGPKVRRVGAQWER